MNKKKIVIFLAIITILFLSGCVASPYYGGAANYYGSGGYYGGVGTRASYYRYQPLFYGSQAFFGVHRHFRGGHRHLHFRGGHRVGGMVYTEAVSIGTFMMGIKEGIEVMMVTGVEAVVISEDFLLQLSALFDFCDVFLFFLHVQIGVFRFNLLRSELDRC